LEANWGFILFRAALLSVILFLVYLSQRFWFVRAWRLAGRVGRPAWRRGLHSACVAGALLVFLPILRGVTAPHGHMFSRGSWLSALLGLWVSSAFVALLAIKLVRGVEWCWLRLKSRKGGSRPHPQLVPALETGVDTPPDPSRRYFFQTASYFAGAVPFIGALYGFAAERLRYQIERVEVPIGNLPPALDGMRIVQLSDIHIGGYMPREQVRRAVEMANDLGAELAVVTGDFITGANDPLEECIAELARLRAPLGVWGCNGNHEIYADAEDSAAELFRHSGMRLLRGENAQLRWRGQPLNLIGVDYQRERSPSGRRIPMLLGVERLVRRDAPNILLSHNPNSFLRAAELGIELTLAGHTHGGQVQVEILDRKWSPARFITDFVAGLYNRPQGLALASAAADESLTGGGNGDGNGSRNDNGNGTGSQHDPPVTNHKSLAPSLLYVNRGLGTIGAPVRIGVPPEITLLTLRRA
jgi:predicted MPP superfamily phosphohydrolase